MTVTVSAGENLYPRFFPVQNIGHGGIGNSPKYWGEIPDMNTMLINVPALQKCPVHLFQKILDEGLGSVYHKDTTFFVDSGGFQNRDSIQNQDPIPVLRLQEKIGSTIASTLDVPIMTDTPAYSQNHQEYTKISITNALTALKHREREEMQLYASLQGYSQTHLLNSLDYLMKHGDFDGFAIGGLLSKRSRFYEIVDIIAAVRQKIGNKPLHIFGMGGPTTIPLMIYAGATSFDSSSFMKAGSKRVYYSPDSGSVKFAELPDDCDYLPCVCPVCSTHRAAEIRKDRKMIALHNLWMITYEMRKIRQHIAEGDFEDYLEDRFKSHPLALDAFHYAKLKVRRLV